MYFVCTMYCTKSVPPFDLKLPQSLGVYYWMNSETNLSKNPNTEPINITWAEKRSKIKEAKVGVFLRKSQQLKRHEMMHCWS